MQDANLASDKILEMASVFDRKAKPLITYAHFYLSAAASFSTPLQHFDFICSGSGYFEFPARPILRASPVAEGVLFRNGFIAKGASVDARIPGVKSDGRLALRDYGSGALVLRWPILIRSRLSAGDVQRNGHDKEEKCEENVSIHLCKELLILSRWTSCARFRSGSRRGERSY